jgi:hypothetical protein
MNELHAQGKTMEEIVEVLNRTPIHPRIIPAIEAAYSLGYNNSLSLFLYCIYNVLSMRIIYTVDN